MVVYVDYLYFRYFLFKTYRIFFGGGKSNELCDVIICTIFYFILYYFSFDIM